MLCTSSGRKPKGRRLSTWAASYRRSTTCSTQLSASGIDASIRTPVFLSRTPLISDASSLPPRHKYQAKGVIVGVHKLPQAMFRQILAGQVDGCKSLEPYTFIPAPARLPTSPPCRNPHTNNPITDASFSNASTPEICEAFCTSNRYPFFALEKADLCRCGATSTNSPSSDKLPAYIEGGGYEPSIGSSNATRIAKPSPEGVQVGDPRFLCHQGRCGGNPEMMGCGTEIAYDLYRNTEPCVLYQAC